MRPSRASSASLAVGTGLGPRSPTRRPSRQGLDLVAGAGDLLLAQHQPLFDRPGAHQVQRPAPALAVEAAPGGLAVDRNHPAVAGLGGEGGNEAAEAGLEGDRVEQPEDPREGVVARNAAFQAQKTPQQRLLGAPEQGHVNATCGAAQGGRQRDQHDLQQIVPLGIAGARVRQIPKTGPKSLHAAILPTSKAAAHQAHAESKRFYKFLMLFPARRNRRLSSRRDRC
jgi:hypothetical protein